MNTEASSRATVFLYCLILEVTEESTRLIPQRDCRILEWLSSPFTHEELGEKVMCVMAD